MVEVKTTERGWAAHLCVASKCAFRRNTLIEAGEDRVVVSTVGNYRPTGSGETDAIGYDRYYETMAFEAEWEPPYWEANIGRQLSFSSEWAIAEIENETDLRANEMHDAVVAEFVAKLSSGELEDD